MIFFAQKNSQTGCYIFLLQKDFIGRFKFGGKKKNVRARVKEIITYALGCTSRGTKCIFV